MKKERDKLLIEVFDKLIFDKVIKWVWEKNFNKMKELVIYVIWFFCKLNIIGIKLRFLIILVIFVVI